MKRFPDAAGIPALGAAQMERDRRIKLGLCAAGLLAGLAVARRFYKPILTAAAVVYVGTRPPVKKLLNQAAALLRGDKL